MDIGQRVREIRKDLGMSAAELARRTGVARNTIVMIEAGRRTPSLGLVEKIAQELRREPADLFVKTASAHIHGQSSLRAEGTVLRIASPDLQAIIRGAVRGELSEEEAMAAAHEKAETV